MNRRTLLFAPLALAGCAPGAPGQPSAAQVIADAQAIVTAVAGLMPALAALGPSVLPAKTLAQVQGYIGIAQGLLANLSTSLPDAANAATLAQIVDAISSALPLIAGIPGLPPQIAVGLTAASVLLPVLVAFVGPLLPAKAPALVAKTATPAAAAMTPDQARAVLKAKP